MFVVEAEAFLRAWLTKLREWQQSSLAAGNGDSLVEFAAAKAIERRSAVRVTYPIWGACGLLPAAEISGQPLVLADISVGGICLVDKNNELGLTAGQDVDIDLSWKDRKAQVTASVISIRRYQRHLRFTNLDPECSVRLTLLLKPGYLGAKVHRLQSPSETIRIAAKEMWMGPTGEHIIFRKTDSDEVAEIRLFQTTYSVLDNGTIVFKHGSGKRRTGQRVDLKVAGQILVFLTNVKLPSAKLMNLSRSVFQWLNEQ